MQTAINVGLQPGAVTVCASKRTGKVINFNDAEAAAKQDPEGWAWFLIEQMVPSKRGNIVQYRRRTALVTGKKKDLDMIIRTNSGGILPGRIVYKDFDIYDASPEFLRLQKEYFNWKLALDPALSPAEQLEATIQANIEAFKHRMSFTNAAGEKQEVYFEDEEGNQFIRFKFWDPNGEFSDTIFNHGNTAELSEFFKTRKAELATNLPDATISGPEIQQERVQQNRTRRTTVSG